jgi:hypothetical protein
MRTSAVYLLESQFMEDKYKFFRCVMKLTSLILLAQRLVYVHLINGRDCRRRHTLHSSDAYFFSSRRRRYFFPAPVQRDFLVMPYALTPPIPRF